MTHATTKAARSKVDLVSLVDKSNPEERAIAFAILKARAKRKQLEAQKRGLK